MKRTKKFFEDIKPRFTKESKNLVYFASGTMLIDFRAHYYSDAFNKFDNIVLVDFHHTVNAIIDQTSMVYWDIFSPFRDANYYESIKKFGTQVKNLSDIPGKVICMRAHAIDAINLFREYRIKFDYYTAINEGWVHYPALNNHGFFGYAMPILKDPFYFLSWEEYYRKQIRTLPYASIEVVKPESNDFVKVYTERPYITTILYHISKPLNTIMKGVFNNTEVYLINKSIWEDNHKLDWKICALKSNIVYDDTVWHRIQDVVDKVSYIVRRDFSLFMQALTDADVEGNRRVGCMSLGLQGDYQDVLDFINEQNFKYIKEIYFYHLNPKDFNDIKVQFTIID